MVRIFLLGSCLIALTACDRQKYTKPIAIKPHGEAVHANMAAHIINPAPPLSRPDVADASQPVLAIEAYRKGEVEEPSRDDAAASTASVQ